MAHRWHLIEGDAGCRYAVEHDAVAIVVDALRASATAAMLLDAGATELICVRTVGEARAVKAARPDVLLFGERGGVPPEDFEGGNSPQNVDHARAKSVVFTTTTGSTRLVAAWGSAAVYFGTTINAAAVIAAARRHERDIVLIPAGLTHDASFLAQEDWTAAAAIADRARADVGEGAATCAHWRERIQREGIAKLFDTSPHAEKLRRVNQQSDVLWCAQWDVTNAVPKAVERTEHGIRVVNEA